MVKPPRANGISNEELFAKFFRIENIHESDTDLDTLFKWRAEVWENCSYKKEENQKDGIIFLCDLINKNCLFKNCPKKHNQKI